MFHQRLPGVAAVAVRLTVVMLVLSPLEAMSWKRYRSATSGVNVGLRIEVDDSVAVEPEG